MAPSHRQMTGDAHMPAAHLDKERVALGHPHGGEVADGPDGEADQPAAQAETHASGRRPVHDGDGARCAAEQDMIGLRPVDGDRSEEHTSELQSLMRISYAVCYWIKNRTQ